MSKKVKKELNVIVEYMVDDLRKVDIDQKNKILNNLSKTRNIIKDFELEKIELQSRKFELQNRKDKFELEKEKLNLEKKKVEIEKEKVEIEKEKLEMEREVSQERVDFEKERLEFEKERFIFEKDKFELERSEVKKDKIINYVVRGIEIGLPIFIYGTLSVLALKATYADDVRVPSETWSFIRGLSKKV